MANPTELNGKYDFTTARIAELEAENARLREELTELRRIQQIDRAFLIAQTMEALPKSEEEFHRIVQAGPTLKQKLRELIPEGREGRPS